MATVKWLESEPSSDSNHFLIISRPRNETLGVPSDNLVHFRIMHGHTFIGQQ
jgi:hypothetical protein